jgi:putative ABC transport system permease protein
VRWRTLLREASVSTLTRWVPAVMVAVLCASMCATTLVTVGRTASAETQVLARLDEAGSRQLVLGDRQGAGLLTPSIVRAADALGTVERAVGLIAPRDVRSGTVGAGGAPVPAWGLVGAVEHAVTLRSGRAPASGEALVAENALDRLGLDGPAGYLVTGETEYPVVGTYTAREPFTDLDAGAVAIPAVGTPARNLHVVARSAADVGVTQALTLQIVAAPQPDDLSVQSATGLAELQGQVAGDLGTFGRHLLLLILGVGAALTAVVVLADVLLRRTDLGRRRALGASRQALVSLVLIRTLIAATAGVLVGTAVGLGIGARWAMSPPWSFAAGTAVLTLLVAVFAAIGPAAIAATRDPVQVLRTP